MNFNYALLENTILLFWDDSENFYKTATQHKIGKDLFQDVVLVDSQSAFDKALESAKSEQLFLFFIHLFHNENNKGYDTYKSSKISKKYPNIITYLISSAPRKQIYETGNNQLDVYPYDGFHEKIGTTFKPQTKLEILGIQDKPNLLPSDISFNSLQVQSVEYALITALYQDEFQQLEKIFDWTSQFDITTKTIKYRIGHLKGNPKKKVVAAIPIATGMVDSAIVATQMLDFFTPKYIFMTGVCGGNPSTNLGDIVVAKKVFTFQKGKLSDLRDPEGNLIQLYDRSANFIDHNHLYDAYGNQIKITLERFEVEHDSMLETDPLLQDTVHHSLKKLKGMINDEIATFGKSIDIHFESVACGTMVINKDGFFNDHIKIMDRKTVAVEMESYGVFRASKFANNGLTKCLIIKSVMDNTVLKDDKAKSLAAYTSAQFLKGLLYDITLP